MYVMHAMHAPRTLHVRFAVYGVCLALSLGFFHDMDAGARFPALALLSGCSRHGHFWQIRRGRTRVSGAIDGKVARLIVDVARLDED